MNLKICDVVACRTPIKPEEVKHYVLGTLHLDLCEICFKQLTDWVKETFDPTGLRLRGEDVELTPEAVTPNSSDVSKITYVPYGGQYLPPGFATTITVADLDEPNMYSTSSGTKVGSGIINIFPLGYNSSTNSTNSL
jgi:hypothetical protein